MKGLLRSLGIVILIAAIGLALWKVSGGDIGSFFDAVGSIIYTILDSVSNFFINVIKMFGV